jgi:hypothetical protein
MNNAPALKLFLASPFALLILMLLASLGNGIKQLLVVRQTGSPMTIAQYLSHWPDTVGTLIGNMLAFAVLISMDQLNVAAALGIGYGVNSVVDLLPGKRSLDLKSTPDDPEKLQARNIEPPPK